MGARTPYSPPLGIRSCATQAVFLRPGTADVRMDSLCIAQGRSLLPCWRALNRVRNQAARGC